MVRVSGLARSLCFDVAQIFISFTPGRPLQPAVSNIPILGVRDVLVRIYGLGIAVLIKILVRRMEQAE